MSGVYPRLKTSIHTPMRAGTRLPRQSDTQLAFNIMRVDGQLLPGLEIKVQNLEVGRVMDEQATQAAVLKTVFLKHAYFFMLYSPPFQPLCWVLLLELLAMPFRLHSAHRNFNQRWRHLH